MRKTKEITIDDRGTAKTFRITEMPATKFEWWIIQAGRALLGAGLGKELPGINVNSAEDVQEKVGNLLANEGLTALNNVDLAKIKPLYVELFSVPVISTLAVSFGGNPVSESMAVQDTLRWFILT